MKYIYGQATAEKTNTKLFAFGVAALAALLLVVAAPVFGATPVVSDKANEKACFGQWRASTADGQVIAGRKGDNAAQNAEDKATCAAPTPEPVPNGGYPAVWADAPIGSIVDSWGMYNRQSTSYVAFKIYDSGRYMPYGFGNPKEWPARATAMGIPVSSTPVVGDAAINMGGYYGHAMYVESINADGSIKVSHYNFDLQGNYGEMVITPAQVANLTYIHF